MWVARWHSPVTGGNSRLWGLIHWQRDIKDDNFVHSLFTILKADRDTCISIRSAVYKAEYLSGHRIFMLSDRATEWRAVFPDGRTLQAAAGSGCPSVRVGRLCDSVHGRYHLASIWRITSTLRLERWLWLSSRIKWNNLTSRKYCWRSVFCCQPEAWLLGTY